MDLEFSKKKQLAYQNKPRQTGLDITEDELQNQCNDTFDAYRIRYIRIPDWVWKWLKQNAPKHLLKVLSKIFGGMPDAIAFKKGEKYNYALMLELKSKKGKLHGKQKHWNKEFNVEISRTPDDSIRIIEEFYNAKI